MPRKSTSSSSSQPKKELWNDRHFRFVPRNPNGTFAGRIVFVSLELEYKRIVPKRKPIQKIESKVEFIKGGLYVYAIKKHIKGRKSEVVTIASHTRLHPKPDSLDRKMIFNAAIQKTSKYNDDVIRMTFLGVFDRTTGKRSKW